MNKKTLVLALLFALLISAIPISSVKAQVPNEDTFTDATIGNAETCDPSWAYDTASAELIFNVYEPLIYFNGPSLEDYIPMIAESWPGSNLPGKGIIPSPPQPVVDPYDPDGGRNASFTCVQTWYFKIKTGASAPAWQDAAYGHVTPQDVEYTFERGMVQDHDGGPQWMILDPLLDEHTLRPGTPSNPGCVKWNINNTAEQEIVGYAIDNAVESNATHVWFNLWKPYAAFQQILCQSWGCIVCKAWVVARGNDFPGFAVTGYKGWKVYQDPDVPGPMMSPPAMMGSGPYMLDYWDTDPDVGWYRLVKFDGYWGGWSPHPHVGTAIIKSVLDHTTRLNMFKSEIAAEQVDTAYVPRALSSTLNGEPGIRYMKDIPTLQGDAMFFNINVDPLSAYMPSLAGVPNATLFRDRHLRLAFAYCVNMTTYLNQVFLGEGNALGNPVVKGIRYYNESKPFYDQNLAMARYHFKMAWGGKDPDGIPNSGDEIPGIVWNQGFSARATYNKASATREPFVLMLELVIETQIGCPAFGINTIVPMGVSWSVYLPELYGNRLGCFLIGWLADFPDPHNWMQPFMHTNGDFSGHQLIEYGLDPASMNWKDNVYGPTNGLPLSATNPYYNYKGDKVTELNNTYVNGLIGTGISLPDTAPPYVKGDGSRNELYDELMDIFYAECMTKMTFQPLGRHWERDWLQGWFYNSIRPGYYVYDLWKEDPATVKRDLGAGLTAWHGSMLYKIVSVTNFGETWEYFRMREWIYVEGELIHYEVIVGWIAPGATIVIVKGPIPIPQDYCFSVCINIRVHIWKWTRCEYYNNPEQYGIPEDNYNNNDVPNVYEEPFYYQSSSTPLHLADLGGLHLPLAPYDYDGRITGRDLDIWLKIFKGAMRANPTPPPAYKPTIPWDPFLWAQDPINYPNTVPFA